MTSRSSGESSSTSETSRASGRGSPARAAETSASGSDREGRAAEDTAAEEGAAEATATERPVTGRSGLAGGGHAEQQRVALAAAAAQRCGAEPAAPAAQLVDQVQGNPGAGCSERVTDRDGPAIDVDDAGIDAKVPDRLQGDGGERLVDLDQVEVSGRQPGLSQSTLDG